MGGYPGYKPLLFTMGGYPGYKPLLYTPWEATLGIITVIHTMGGYPEGH